MRLLTLREPQVPPNGPPKIPGQTPPEIDPSSYCARRLAGLETGPIPNIGPSTAAAIWALVGAASLFLFLRIYCKIWKSRGIWWDDLVLIVSWVCSLLRLIPSSLAISHPFLLLSFTYPSIIHSPQSSQLPYPTQASPSTLPTNNAPTGPHRQCSSAPQASPNA